MQHIKKIVAIGPESTGKSSLCEGLARHFKSVWAREYAREYLKKHGTKYVYENLDAIAEGQGTVAIVPHFGTWEVMNAWLSLHVAPVIMYKPGKDPGVDQFVRQARGRLKANMVSTAGFVVDSTVQDYAERLVGGGFV